MTDDLKQALNAAGLSVAAEIELAPQRRNTRALRSDRTGSTEIEAAVAPSESALVLVEGSGGVYAWACPKEEGRRPARRRATLCSSGTGYDIAPRDCAILSIIPDLLVNYIWVEKFEEARTEGARGVARLPAKHRGAINDLLSSYIELDRVAARVGGPGVHPLMIDMISSRRDTVARNCSSREAFRPRTRSKTLRFALTSAAMPPAILPRRCRSLLSPSASRT